MHLALRTAQQFRVAHRPNARRWLLAALLMYQPGANYLSAWAQDFEFFEKKIRPVLVDRCYQCHSLTAEKIKGGLLLDSQQGILKGGSSGQPAIIPGDADASHLIEAIRYTNEELQMPPPKIGRLTPQQIADFVAWVNMGAPDPRTTVSSNSLVAKDKYKTAQTHWAFQPVARPLVPPIEKTPSPAKSQSRSAAQTAIDHFILVKLARNGLSFSPPADKRTLIRRASFDLTGLPPTPEQVEAFLKDTSSEAFTRVVDRLLASEHYGERWARHWLDVARFADTKGYVYGDREDTRFIHSAAYRDWVIHAFNEDLPYDQFLKLQLAADQIEGVNLDSLAAMGYLTLGRRFLGVVHDIIDDRIDVVMRGMQALTVGCARCHDHKFDPIPTADYYSLYGVFAGCYEREIPLNPAGKTARAYLDFEQELKTREARFQSLFNAKREQLSKQLRARVTEYLVAVLNVEKLPSEEFYSFVQGDDLNAVVVRAWHTYLLSSAKTFHSIWTPWQAFSHLPTNEFASQAARVISSCTNQTQKLNPLVEKTFTEKVPSSMKEVAELYGNLLVSIDKKWSEASDKTKALNKDEDELRQVLCASDSPASVPPGAMVDLEWYFDEATRVELAKVSSQIPKWILQAPGAPPYAVILEDRAVQKNPHIFRRGNPANPGEEIPRQFLTILAGTNRKPFAKGSGRLELAEAIASKENPLTARVFVNRVWLHHFGNGLVRTPSDFGTRAELPSHPELLDWLANYFMDHGWSVKALHRLILLSAVYQQSSAVPALDRQRVKSAGTSSHPERVEVKFDKLKSSMQDRANQIDPENKLLWRMNRQRLDFESLRDSLLFVSGDLDPRPGGRAEDLLKPPFSKRRSIYGFIDRQFLPGAYRAFDFANPDMHNPQRSETIVPQQALFFMNGSFVVEKARALAARAAGPEAENSRTRSDLSSQVKTLYKLVYQREPTAEQSRKALDFLTAPEPDQTQDAPARPTVWTYGYGEVDETAGQLKSFEPLPHFTGDAWQGGAAWPDDKLGWAQLTAAGGHAGNDSKHAVVRRWTAPANTIINIAGLLKHEHSEGDGIRGYVFSNSNTLLAHWTLHNQELEARIDKIDVKKDDKIDFVVAINQSLNSNDFLWSPVIRTVAPSNSTTETSDHQKWDAKKEFAGPPGKTPRPLSRWEQLAQVLLLTNEFLFVD